MTCLNLFSYFLPVKDLADLGTTNQFEEFHARVWAYVQNTNPWNSVSIYYRGEFQKDKIKLYVHNREHLAVYSNSVSSMYGYFTACLITSLTSSKATYRCPCDIGIDDKTTDVGCRYIFISVNAAMTLCDIRVPS